MAFTCSAGMNVDAGNSKDVQFEKQIIKQSFSLSLIAVLLQPIQGFCWLLLITCSESLLLLR